MKTEILDVQQKKKKTTEASLQGPPPMGKHGRKRLEKWELRKKELVDRRRGDDSLLGQK